MRVSRRGLFYETLAGGLGFGNVALSLREQATLYANIAAPRGVTYTARFTPIVAGDVVARVLRENLDRV
jgi:hypothetical protein